jgi:hypothetical protein
MCITETPLAPSDSPLLPLRLDEMKGPRPGEKLLIPLSWWEGEGYHSTSLAEKGHEKELTLQSVYGIFLAIALRLLGSLDL